MVTKVFVIGRPGSGKSEAALCIERKAREKGIPCTHIDDYPLLYQMYVSEMSQEVPAAHRKFASTDPFNPEAGFTIDDLSAFNDVLSPLQSVVDDAAREHTSGIVLIELARDNYRTLFRRLSPDFYKDSHILFIDSNVDISLERIGERAKKLGRGAISEDFMRSYYGRDNWQYMVSPDGFRKDFGVEYYRFFALKNEGSLEKFIGDISSYADKNLRPSTGDEKRYKVLVMVGPPSSGKDTYADQYMREHPNDWAFISSDRKLYEIGKREGIVDADGRVLYMDVISHPSYYEEAVSLAYEDMKMALAEGKDIIVCRTNTMEVERATTLKLVPDGYEKIAVVMETPVEVIRRRLTVDPKAVPYPAVADRIEYFEPVSLEEGFDRITIVSPDKKALLGAIMPAYEMDLFSPGKFAAINPELYDLNLLDNLVYKAERVPEIIVVSGVPYSGKTTWVTWHKLQHPSRDYVVISDDNELYAIGKQLSMADSRGRVLMTDVFVKYYEEAKMRSEKKLYDALVQGKDIIVDQSNITPKRRRAILNAIPRERNYLKKAVFMDVSIEKIRKRWMEERDRKTYGKGVSAIDMRKAVDNYRKPKLSEGFDVVQPVYPHEVPMCDTVVNGTDRYKFVPGTIPEEDPLWLDSSLLPNGRERRIHSTK